MIIPLCHTNSLSIHSADEERRVLQQALAEREEKIQGLLSEGNICMILSQY